MSRICRGCGGVLGRDCFHESDCVWISETMHSDNARDAERFRNQQYFESLKDHKAYEAHLLEEELQAPLLVASMAHQIEMLELENEALRKENEKLRNPTI